MNKNIIKRILQEGLNIPKKKKHLLWVGIDDDLMTSLDYGFICRQDERYDYDDWMILGKIGEDNYFISWISERELNDIIKGDGFYTADDINGLLSYVGLENTRELLDLPFIQKFSDMINYFGIQNLFPFPGQIFNFEEAIGLLNKYSGEDPISAEDYL